jgi:hypothetical protein
MISVETARGVIPTGLQNGGRPAQLDARERVSLQLGLDDQKVEGAVRGPDLRFPPAAGAIRARRIRVEGMVVAGRGGREPEPGT